VFAAAIFIKARFVAPLLGFQCRPDRNGSHTPAIGFIQLRTARGDHRLENLTMPGNATQAAQQLQNVLPQDRDRQVTAPTLSRLAFGLPNALPRHFECFRDIALAGPLGHRRLTGVWPLD
jgi:hypothetical protein